MEFIFTPEHTKAVQALLEQLASPDVSEFQDFPATIAGDRPFQLFTEVFVDELGCCCGARASIRYDASNLFSESFYAPA